MIIDNDPPITRHISIPKDMSQLSCSALTAGIVEAVLDGLGFVRIIAPQTMNQETPNSCLPALLPGGASDCTFSPDRCISFTDDNSYQA